MTNAYSVSPQQIVSDAERFLRARYHVDFANAHDFQLHDAIAQGCDALHRPQVGAG